MAGPQLQGVTAGLTSSLATEYARGNRPIDIFNATSTTSVFLRMGDYLDETHRRVGHALARQGKAAKQGRWSAIANKLRLTEKNLRPMFLSPLKVIEDNQGQQKKVQNKTVF
jgi:hypothetical protein